MCTISNFLERRLRLVNIQLKVWQLRLVSHNVNLKNDVSMLLH